MIAVATDISPANVHLHLSGFAAKGDGVAHHSVVCIQEKCNRIGLAAIMFVAALPVLAQDGGSAASGNTNPPTITHKFKPASSPEPTAKQDKADEAKSVEPQAQPSLAADGANATGGLHADLDAYQKNDYPAALKKLIPLANKGDATAQLRLGIMNEMGQGVTRNYHRAIVRYRQAAEQGNAEAQYRLGEKYDLGQGVLRNRKIATEWYVKSASQGYAEAQAKLKSGAKAITGLQAGLNAYQRGNYHAALKKLIPLANKGNATAQLHLGLMNEMGQGVPRSYNKAMRRYLQAAAQGNAEAQYHLGEKYDLGQGIPQNKKLAAEWYSKSASQGYAVAQAKIKAEEEARVAEQAKAEEQAKLKAEAKAKAKEDAEAKAAEQARAAEQEYWIAVMAQTKRKAEAKARAEAEAKATEQSKAREEVLSVEEIRPKAEAKVKAEEEVETKGVEQARIAAEAKAAKQAKAEEAKLAHPPVASQKMLAEHFVKSWAAAWSAKNVHDYLAAYVPDFKPEGMSHDTWKEQRVDRISKPKVIEVKLSGINLMAHDDSHVTISFTQSYRSDNYHAKTGKTLQMVRQSDRWLIAEESAGKAVKTGANHNMTKPKIKDEVKAKFE